MSDLQGQIDIPGGSSVVDLAYNSVGDVLGVLHADGSTQIYQLDENRHFQSVGGTAPICHNACSLTFAPPEWGTVFAFADTGGEIFLYQRRKQQGFVLSRSLPRVSAAINDIKFGTTGLVIAVAASDGSLYILQSRQQNWELHVLKIAETPLIGISFAPTSPAYITESPTTQMAAVGSADGRISIVVPLRGWSVDGAHFESGHKALMGIGWRCLSGVSRMEIATCGTNEFGGGDVFLWRKEGSTWIKTAIYTSEIPLVSIKWSVCGFILAVGNDRQQIFHLREVTPGHWVVMSDENC